MRINIKEKDEIGYTVGPFVIVKEFDCPDEKERIASSAAAWDALQQYSPAAQDWQGSSPSTILGRNISKEKPKVPKNVPFAWDAHHIVPVKDGGNQLKRLRAFAFNCHVAVTSARNGVWLRGRTLGKHREEYRRLPPSLRKRTRHTSTTGSNLSGYAAALNSEMRPLMNEGVLWGSRPNDHRSANRSGFQKRVSGVKLMLKRGSFVPKSWEKRCFDTGPLQQRLVPWRAWVRASQRRRSSQGPRPQRRPAARQAAS